MIKETTVRPLSAYIMLVVCLFILAFAILIPAFSLLGSKGLSVIGGLVVGFIFLFTCAGFFIINPNESKVLILFGEYKGTVKDYGFFWANPFMVKKNVSLRARNLNGSTLKVNDKLGNPIEIAAVIVWQVRDTAKAILEVDDYQQFVVIQSEAAVRHLANTFPYDTFDDDHEPGLTLRAGAEKVNELLELELNERLARAGIFVLEARISHLAYASEIAGAMLQRQQAIAVVAARRQIVEGAVGMVEMALDRLSEKQIVNLDEERKAAMVSNLLVVLCGEKAVHPILNAGTLHH
ncbi:SPFH domain-containing protein [Rhodocytophaga aerolata]|uniref:SPFH domain-containing protein n=1 Tax=Rhodocytophaga aerolata TaxID=455078 RepID=A0ABT8QYY2_9BACT|nr:SPFH domain-containing protein [Rhodocytophaga aerolata]MDO1445053.1 SPFH domain-containing protein [Rhodocytophaga aerolata]